MRRRMSSDNPFHAAIRPDSRTKAGISPTAHKCAHSNSKDAVFGDKTRGNSSPVSPIAEKPVIPACCAGVTGFLMRCRAAADIAATTPNYVPKSFKRLG